MDPCLIIGCGYLGRRVAARWLAQGRRVSAITRRHGDDLRSLGIEPIVADVLDAGSIPRLPPAATILYAVGFDRAAGASLRSVYVDGLRNVLAKLAPGGRFIYVSSTGVYGDAGGDWVDETTPPNPLDEAGRVVLDAESTLRAARPDAIVLRFAGIYGPGRLLRVQAIRRGEPLATDADKWLNLIHVEDGVQAILAAESRGLPGTVYNVADGNPVKRGDYYQRLAEILGAPPPRFVSPTTVERGDRRIGNRKMLAELGVTLHVANFEAGLAASAGAHRDPAHDQK